ncbi:MAG: hypothetical protein DRN33_01180 [Thermoplasmata archaeon]|jgi:hypothetical protein|nr:MAG: hypothetical protein FE043_00440 [Thermoplasmata archaeon]RLF64784.1 MAG: hypothetical protein DRN33_01180 [Thermoplasmata archaeon]
MKVERIVPAIAVCLLLLGAFSTVYVESSKEKIIQDTIKINDKELEISKIMKSCRDMSIEPEAGGNYEGISLSDMINFSGVKNPAEHRYKILGSDGYSKTVEWNDMNNGIFDIEKRIVIFTNLPKQFWVKDVVEIKVV